MPTNSSSSTDSIVIPSSELPNLGSTRASAPYKECTAQVCTSRRIRRNQINTVTPARVRVLELRYERMVVRKDYINFQLLASLQAMSCRCAQTDELCLLICRVTLGDPLIECVFRGNNPGDFWYNKRTEPKKADRIQLRKES